jgi:hypothetical protein
MNIAIAIAIRLLFGMATLPSIKTVSSYGPNVWRPVKAYSSILRNGSARHHRHDAWGRQSAITTLSSMRQRQPVISTFHTVQCVLSRSFSTRRSFSMQQLMTSDYDGLNESNGKNRVSFDVPLLKKETMRLILRTHKKIEKASTRIRGAEEQYDRLRAAIDASPSEEVDEKIMQQIEQAPNVEQYKEEMSGLQHRLHKLNWLEEQFNNPPLKGKKQLTIYELETLYPEGARVVRYVLELDINDDESLKLKKIETDVNNKRAKAEKAVSMKEQGQHRQGGRLPYRRYYSEQRTEIRVSGVTDAMNIPRTNEHDTYCILCAYGASPLTSSSM